MKWVVGILKPGDHIRVKRTFYYHHGIYVGNDEVIHYCGEQGDSISDPSKVLVRKTSADFFAREGIIEKASLTKGELRNKRPSDDIIASANKMLGIGGYDFYRNNCEDLAVRCCYKKPISTQLKNKNKQNPFLTFIYAVVRVFIKFTGFFAYIIYLKPRYLYVSEKAKKEFKNNKKGAIICSNHTRIFDYYVLLFKFVFKHIRAMVADVVYKIPTLRFFNNVMGNIEIKRDGNANIDALDKASYYLRQNKIVVIFPEGKLEDKKGKFENFHDSAVYLAISENKPIIPIYIDGKYGMFKRPLCVVGEKQYFSSEEYDCYNKQDVKKCNEKLEKTIQNLKILGENANKYKTKRLWAPRYWMLDFVRAISLPFFYWIFPTKKVFIGNKKKVKSALKNNALLLCNHYGFCDVTFIYQHFLSRRIRIVASEVVWNAKIMRYGMNHGGVIKYHLISMNGIDYQAYKEIVGTLNGHGVVSMFPEGHFNKETQFSDEIKSGAAAISLITNSPIIPFMFIKPYKPFRKNVVKIGEPIYPDKFIDESKGELAKQITSFNEIIYDKMKNLLE